MAKKVFVSGCFDMLHSGHIEFFRGASQYGDVYVALGSDRTVFELKGRATINSEEERLFMVKSVSFIKDAFVSRGSGILDFEGELREMMPDYFIVNADGHIPEKRDLCQQLGIKYVILERKPYPGFEARSTTQLRQRDQLPYRIDLAGGWLDQPFVSKHHPGPVITISLEPTLEFNERSGMATSTRRHAQEIWGPRLPQGDYEKSPKYCFAMITRPVQRSFPVPRTQLGWFILVWHMHIMRVTTGRLASSIVSMSRFCNLWKIRFISSRLVRDSMGMTFWRAPT